MTRAHALLPVVGWPQDSDLWAIYTRACLGQVLDVTAKAALVDDPDLEARNANYVQPARPAPRRGARR